MFTWLAFGCDLIFKCLADTQDMANRQWVELNGANKTEYWILRNSEISFSEDKIVVVCEQVLKQWYL